MSQGSFGWEGLARRREQRAWHGSESSHRRPLPEARRAGDQVEGGGGGAAGTEGDRRQSGRSGRRRRSGELHGRCFGSVDVVPHLDEEDARGDDIVARPPFEPTPSPSPLSVAQPAPGPPRRLPPPLPACARRTTAVVVSLRGATLRWAYVGDSGFARGGRVVRRSRQQQHRFNCPYQLRSTGGDGVGDAAVGEMQVAEGDVVVVGTDGLFDNVFDHELQWMVRKGAEMGLNPQVMADEIAAAAYAASRSTAPSPFSVESARNYVKDGKEMHYGGKADDITVVVAYVVSKHS
ncbi:hypothetical protein PR202_ga02073 [Eleusine coracana subsp. coracana]|uniref:Protein phosphatase n=1 Tax=Eleusine coracana subsp. coracana TaxID=191504 RepID=A0AAV5BGV2_ELECO|nr:hypothetical protein PR202_ga01386 [Eleusine coracana subsp. coracana]GJM86232.1 hypothetical protein PR202_ga02073 [Eleusine coracana subsp. coracana]